MADLSKWINGAGNVESLATRHPEELLFFSLPYRERVIPGELFVGSTAKQYIRKELARASKGGQQPWMVRNEGKIVNSLTLNHTLLVLAQPEDFEEVNIVFGHLSIRYSHFLTLEEYFASKKETNRLAHDKFGSIWITAASLHQLIFGKVRTPSE